MLTSGTDDLIASLVSVLEHISGGTKSSALLPDIEAIDRVQKQIGVLGLTARTADGLELTPLGREWLRNQDPVGLFLIFHSRLAYIGELLERLSNGPATVQELLSHACDDYRMAWKTPDQVRRRLAWLRAFGLVSEGPHRLHLITDLGHKVLTQIDVAAPDEILRIAGSGLNGELPAPPPLLAEEVTAASAESRKLPIGFLAKNPDQATRTVVNAAIGGVARDQLVEELSGRLSISQSSASGFLWTTSRMGLVEYTGKEEISPTELGIEWLSCASPLNLVRLMHARYLVVGETLLRLDDQPKSIGEIHRAIYGEDAREAPNHARTAQVLRLLVAAEAVGHIGSARYVITPVGRALTAELPMLEVERDEGVEGAPTRYAAVQPAPVALRQELLAASRDTARPDRFERACAAAFSALGVDAKHVGGPGARMSW